MTHLSKPLVVGGAAALIVSSLVIGVAWTLVLVVVLAGAYLFARSRRPGGRPTAGPGFPTSTGPAASAAARLPYAAVPPAPASTTGAVELIDAIKQDCLAQGFFVKHAVKVEKARKREPLRVVLSAVTRTSSAFIVTVTATESPYGTHLQCECGEKGQGLGSALLVNAMGSAAKTGYEAGRGSALKRKQAELELELKAFRSQVLSKYDQS